MPGVAPELPARQDRLRRQAVARLVATGCLTQIAVDRIVGDRGPTGLAASNRWGDVVVGGRGQADAGVQPRRNHRAAGCGSSGIDELNLGVPALTETEAGVDP